MRNTQPQVSSGPARLEGTGRPPDDRAGVQTAWERLFVAVGYLAHGSGTLQYRLDCAYVRCLVPLLNARIPDNVRAELDQIIAILAGTNTHLNELATRHNIAKLPDSEAKEAARRMLSLFSHVARSYPLGGQE